MGRPLVIGEGILREFFRRVDALLQTLVTSRLWSLLNVRPIGLRLIIGPSLMTGAGSQDA